MELTNLMIYVTNNCNLRCFYCFVNKDERRMDFKTAKASVDFLIRQEKKTEKLSINFFGGEPLLEFDLIKKVVEYSKQQGEKYNRNFKFNVTTNATLFTKEIVDYFWENDFGVLFSFDGDKKQIVKVKGVKAYNQMLNSVKLLKKRDFRLYARVTVRPDDLRMVDAVKHIFKVGFDAASLCQMSGTDAWNKEETENAFMELADYYIQQANKDNILALNFINKDLMASMGVQKPSERPCGAGRGLIAVTVDGKILPCQHPETWEQNHVLGNVFEKKLDEEIRRPFLEYTRDDFIGCDNCIARSHCIGACLSINYDESKNMLKPWNGGCIWTRARYKASKYIFEELYVKQKNLFLIRMALKSVISDGRSRIESVFDASKIEDYDYNKKFKSISFKIAEQDLNLKTGDKIVQFLNKARESNNELKITRPLPPCLFGSKSSEIFKKFDIPMQKGKTLEKLKTPDSMIESCDVGKDFTPQIKKRRELYKYYIKNVKIPEKCESCIYRIRKQCDYAYFGF